MQITTISKLYNISYTYVFMLHKIFILDKM